MSSTAPFAPAQTARLLTAARGGQVDEVRAALLEGADPDAHDRHKTALHWAVYNSHEAVVMALLDGGASLARLNARGETALFEVAVYGSAHQDLDGAARAGRIAQALLDRGADPVCVSRPDANAMTRNGQRTAAHTLAESLYGEPALRKILQVAPDLVHAVDQRGNIPLMLAVQERRTHHLDPLLAAGSDPYAENLTGASPMNVAKKVSPGMAERMNVELMNREREVLLPLATTGLASITPPRSRTRL